MKRWLKRLILGAGAVVLLLLLVLVTEHFRGKHALNRQISELTAKGEALAVASLQPKSPPADQNAFVDLASITNRTDSILTNLLIAPPSLRFTQPGKAIVAWQLTHWSDDGKTTNDWNEIGPDLERARELLNMIESAVQKPAYESGFDYAKGFVDFQIGPLVKVKQAAQLLSAATLYELNRGRIEAAHANLRALIRLVAIQEPEPLIICQLVRHACAGIAFNTTWQALQQPEWTERQLATLQAEWENCEIMNEMGLAMEMERALTLDFHEQIRSSKDTLRFAVEQRESMSETMDGLFGSVPTRGWILKHVHVPIWRFAWSRQDQLRSLHRWQFIIERERMARTNSWAALSDVARTDDEMFPFMPFMEKADELGWYDRLRFLFSGDTFSITDIVIRRTHAAQTLQQMAVAAIAVQRHHAQTGTFPANLSALLPDYFTALPKDHMDGKTLRYRLEPNTGFVLYSVGEDAIDDGGDPTVSSEDKSYRQIWDGRDAVWPAPATAEETAAAMNTK